MKLSTRSKIILSVLLFFVIRNVGVNIQLLPRTQLEIATSFYLNRNDFEQYVEAAKSLVDASGYANFSVQYDEYDRDWSVSSSEKTDVVLAALKKNVQSMYEIMPFKTIGIYSDNDMQVDFELSHERGIIYTANGKRPDLQFLVYSSQLADHWYYYEEDMKRVLEIEAKG